MTFSVLSALAAAAAQLGALGTLLDRALRLRLLGLGHLRLLCLLLILGLLDALLDLAARSVTVQMSPEVLSISIYRISVKYHLRGFYCLYQQTVTTVMHKWWLYYIQPTNIPKSSFPSSIANLRLLGSLLLDHFQGSTHN